MSSPLPGSSTIEKFKALSDRKPAAQAKWFLNAYWSSGPSFGDNDDDREHVFDACKSFKKHLKAGTQLDQLDAHHFLERTHSALTWRTFKAKFAELDLDFNNNLSLAEYLIFRFDLADDVDALVAYTPNAIAGLVAAEELIAKATEDLEAVQASRAEAAAAKVDAEEARAEAKRVMDEINALKEKHARKATQLETKITKAAGKVVKQNRLRFQLEEHKNKKPVSNKMELTQQAAVRRVKKSVRACARTVKRCEAAVKVCEASLEAAHKNIAKLKKLSRNGSKAVLWWMERELKDMEKTMSKKAFEKKQQKLLAKKAAASKALDAALGRQQDIAAAAAAGATRRNSSTTATVA